MKIIAINDKFIRQRLVQIQKIEGGDVEVIRFPSFLPVDERFADAKKFISSFSPQWISLQFVVFGYHRKGLPFHLISRLKKLGKDAKWHIMFHELWTGMEAHSNIKLQILGAIQKYIIKRLLVTSNPTVIHTQTRIYQQQVSKLGFECLYLPLFSNISTRAIISRGPKNGVVKFVMFGSIHPGAPVIEFVEELKAYLRNYNLKGQLTIIGRAGSEQNLWKKHCVESGLVVSIMGEQSESIISNILSTSSYGISTTPFLLLEKSGTVAAMFENRLSVICVAKQWFVKSLKNAGSSDGIFEYKKGNLTSILNGVEKTLPVRDITSIAHQFVESLSNGFNRKPDI